jgi:hypothetical protein
VDIFLFETVQAARIRLLIGRICHPLVSPA